MSLILKTESDTGNFVMDLETSMGIYSIDDSEIKDIQIITKASFLNR